MKEGKRDWLIVLLLGL